MSYVSSLDTTSTHTDSLRIYWESDCTQRTERSHSYSYKLIYSCTGKTNPVHQCQCCVGHVFAHTFVRASVWNSAGVRFGVSRLELDDTLVQPTALHVSHPYGTDAAFKGLGTTRHSCEHCIIKRHQNTPSSSVTNPPPPPPASHLWCHFSPPKSWQVVVNLLFTQTIYHDTLLNITSAEWHLWQDEKEGQRWHSSFNLILYFTCVFFSHWSSNLFWQSLFFNSSTDSSEKTRHSQKRPI